MRKPKNGLEQQAKRDWTQGSPVTAMLSLRREGYGEAARRAFLVDVVGVRGVDDLELFRDSYLDWASAGQ